MPRGFYVLDEWASVTCPEEECMPEYLTPSVGGSYAVTELQDQRVRLA